jgi:GTP diphosphokinase / guanosine-3',5'-bis(diphosphate) 3'-diphosphatase
MGAESPAVSLTFEAMVFAREVHKGQVRKYTANPYVDHLAEVAGIVATVSCERNYDRGAGMDTMVAVSWLHDSIEDQDVKFDDLFTHFGIIVATGVQMLSDTEQGNRAERKAASRARLAAAPGWVQTIKVADLISNTSSIVKHDPNFAVQYLIEKTWMLDVLMKADKRLINIARDQVYKAQKELLA